LVVRAAMAEQRHHGLGGAGIGKGITMGQSLTGDAAHGPY